MSKKGPVTILFLGLPDAGKTTIQYRLKFDEICTTVPTHGFNFHNLEYKKTKIECWDYGGSNEVQEKLWAEAIGKADGIFWVVDANNHDQLNDSRDTLFKYASRKITQVPICILANKYDLPNAMPADEITKHFSGYTDAKVFHICAMESKSVDKALAWMLDEIKGKSKDKKKGKKEKEKKEKKDKKDKKDSAPPKIDYNEMRTD